MNSASISPRPVLMPMSSLPADDRVADVNKQLTPGTPPTRQVTALVTIILCYFVSFVLLSRKIFAACANSWGAQFNRRDATNAERQSRSRSARSVWSAGYAPALKRHPTAKAGAYPALQTLREIHGPHISSQLASNLDYWSAGSLVAVFSAVIAPLRFHRPPHSVAAWLLWVFHGVNCVFQDRLGRDADRGLRGLSRRDDEPELARPPLPHPVVSSCLARLNGLRVGLVGCRLPISAGSKQRRT